MFSKTNRTSELSADVVTRCIKASITTFSDFFFILSDYIVFFDSVAREVYYSFLCKLNRTITGCIYFECEEDIAHAWFKDGRIYFVWR